MAEQDERDQSHYQLIAAMMGQRSGLFGRAGDILRRAALPALLAFACLSCASHSDRTKVARSALDAGSPTQALTLYNQELEVDSADKVPADLGGDAALLILDRSIILQSLRQYELSARDLGIADKQIEMLDFSRDTVDDIGKYLYSDDVGPYRAPFYEMLMINTMNMINYLVMRDLQGAKVEARRLAVMQKYIRDRKGQGQELLGPGSYFAGFIFEHAGEPQEALRYYDEALQYHDYSSLEEPVVRLSERASYRSPRINAILRRAGKRPQRESPGTESGGESSTEGKAADAPQPPPSTQVDDADLLVVVNYGRVPAKIPKRIPIGLALTYASGSISPYNQGRANRLAAQGLVTWVNYPELGKPRGNYAIPELFVNGREERLEQALAVDLEAKKEWERAKGAIVASAITRTITRVIAGEAAGKAAGKATGDSIWGVLISLFTQATLTAADTPDTRSWATLPARVAVGRLRIPPGKHTVVVRARGREERYKVTVRAGDWAVVNLTELR